MTPALMQSPQSPQCPQCPQCPPRAGRHAALLLAALLASLAGSSQAAAQVLLPPPQNVVSLAADASAEVLQDMLTITLGVTREGADAASVQSQLRQVLDAALVEARKAQRPGQVEPRTGAFSLYPRYNPKPGAGNSISGWQGRAELLLEGRDVAAISLLAGRLGNLGNPGGAGVAAGMVVSRVAFSLSREAREAAEAEVVTQAISRFKGRAETYARQFGFGSYSLREVSVGAGEVAAPMGQPTVRMMRSAAAPAAADEAQPVEAGKATVSVTVSGSIQLSPR